MIYIPKIWIKIKDLLEHDLTPKQLAIIIMAFALVSVSIFLIFE